MLPRRPAFVAQVAAASIKRFAELRRAYLLKYQEAAASGDRGGVPGTQDGKATRSSR